MEPYTNARSGQSDHLHSALRRLQNSTGANQRFLNNGITARIELQDVSASTCISAAKLAIFLCYRCHQDTRNFDRDYRAFRRSDDHCLSS